MTRNINEDFIPIVLCAGFGTRLKPLTDYFPKTVCPILNKPAAFLHIERFWNMGFEKVYCNVFYLKDIVIDELTSCAQYFGYDPKRIVFYKEDPILETGGGILNIFEDLKKKESRNAQKDVMVVSGDIVSDFSFERLVPAWRHKKEEEYAFMCVKKTKEPRKDALWFDALSEAVVGFGENLRSAQSEEDKKNICHGVFTNYQMISHKVLNNTSLEVLSSIHLFYKKILSQNKMVRSVLFEDYVSWFDIGTPASYLDCLKTLSGGADKPQTRFILNKIYSQNKINFNKAHLAQRCALHEILQDAVLFAPPGLDVKEGWHRLESSIFYFHESLL